MKAEPIHLLSLPLKHALNQDHLSNVEIADLLIGDGIFYDSATQKWKNREHRHYTALQDWTKEETSLKSTTSEVYTILIETISKPYDTARMLLFLFTHNVKNNGTLASRGADFKLCGHDDFGEYDINGASFRWTDGLADFKTMTVVFVKLIGAGTEIAFKIKWKVDDTNYMCSSKNRFFAIKHWVHGAGIAELW